ncbi:MBL fold metallo-hydrolase [Algibacter lectus]|uniref:Glyoxylase-like metal-dependent hydrolase (Beta-lactamase superfamily II) n=1 Tax=Algibacter lectus TaxID=221126 RepID=A0A4R8M4Y4_9FLAO|nr:MBL fold metallo-hydrolase [Algibacter lectus]MWW26194.1 MBL fold metallo-hydrolase [Algibacter lectus]TDY60330.1 glyoxylase-like metal-dependent hydrolase (beta-lactamase superfamily II) [Algibacter lectus]
MKFLKLSLIIFFLFFNVSINAQSKFDKVNIKTTKLSDHIYMLEGSGGNIGVSVGNDGVFIIDTQFAPLTPKILTAIKKLSDQPVKIVANTHHHGDHTGGNKNLGDSGATIIAHENVRKRLLEKSAKSAIPVITFNDKLNIQMNNEQVAIFHVENAHTDGDAMLYFTESNVLHTGDTFFNARYPYIDINSGGSINGYINAVKSGLMVVDNDTKIIPGHGNLSNKAEYLTFLNMLETVKAAVLKEIENGKTEDQVSENTSLTKTYDDLGYGDHFINSKKMRRTVYQSLKN